MQYGGLAVYTGNAHPQRAPYGIYPCHDDGWIAIDCQTDEQWTTLAGLIGHPEWGVDGAQFATAKFDGNVSGGGGVGPAFLIMSKYEPTLKYGTTVT